MPRLSAILILMLSTLRPLPAMEGEPIVPPPPRPAVERLEGFVDSLAQRLDPRARGALERVTRFDRKLLALRYYMIRASQIDSLWAWTTSEVRRFERTEEYRRTMRAVRAVQDSFAARNPGYHLTVNTGHRPLGVQIGKWNRVSSVGQAADTLLRHCRWLLSDSLAIDPADPFALELFSEHLLAAPDPIEPTVALPGYSGHGRLRAFDFKVKKGGRLIAGAVSRTIEQVWERGGWTERLREAIAAAGGEFVGPLPDPYEPWHWTYVPRGAR